MAEAITETWITDTGISTRFPYYTRANADEVGPEPFSPLGWSLGWAKGCIPGVAEGFVRFGVVRREEFALDPPEVSGNWGGYFYNQLSLPRVMGVRMPGATWEAIELAYFGGFSHSEIASMVSLPLGTVKGRMRLGLEKIRADIAESITPEAIEGLA